MSKKILDGYYLIARRLSFSDIRRKPPHFREIWQFLIESAEFRDIKSLRRGQLCTSYQEISEALCWYVGRKKYQYSHSKVKNAIQYFRKTERIKTERSRQILHRTAHRTSDRTSDRTAYRTSDRTSGWIITICNYEVYQNVKNYICNDIQNDTQNYRQNRISNYDGNTSKEEERINTNRKKEEESLTPLAEQAGFSFELEKGKEADRLVQDFVGRSGHEDDEDVGKEVVQKRKRRKSKKKVSVLVDYSEYSGFCRFWESWTVNRVNKREALKIWLDFGLDDVLEHVLSGVRRYRSSKKWKDGYVEAPDVWLRNFRWEDDVGGMMKDECRSVGFSGFRRGNYVEDENG